jgi:phytoene synthase
MSGGGVIADAVREAARHTEADRYLAALLAPRPVRSDLAALAAFSAELARIRDTVSDAMIGEIRLQWWRDALQSLARGEVTGHPVADALGDTIRRRHLPLPLLEAPIEARSMDLAGEPPADAAALAAYFSQAEGALFEAALAVLDVADTPARRDAAGAAGRAYGLARALARLPQALTRGLLPIPLDRLEAAGVPLAAPELVRTHPAIPGLVRDMRQEAEASLSAARRAAGSLGSQAVPAFLPLVMVEPYLRGLERGGADPFAPVAEAAPIRRVWRLWRAKRRGRF